MTNLLCFLCRPIFQCIGRQQMPWLLYNINKLEQFIEPIIIKTSLCFFEVSITDLRILFPKTKKDFIVL